eukprot:gene1986-2443_t
MLSEETVHFELEEDFDIDYPKSKYGWATHRIPFTRKQWLYLLVAQGAIPAVINFLVNLFLTWLIYPKDQGAMIPFSGSLTCIISDIIVTSLLIPTIGAIIGSVLITIDLRKGKLIQPIDERWLNHPWISKIPTGIHFKVILKRAIMLGIVGLIIFPWPTLLILYAAVGKEGMVIKWTFIIFKSIWSALIAFIVSPFIAFILVASFNPRHTFY